MTLPARGPFATTTRYSSSNTFTTFHTLRDKKNREKERETHRDVVVDVEDEEQEEEEEKDDHRSFR